MLEIQGPCYATTICICCDALKLIEFCSPPFANSLCTLNVQTSKSPSASSAFTASKTRLVVRHERSQKLLAQRSMDLKGSSMYGESSSPDKARTFSLCQKSVLSIKRF